MDLLAHKHAFHELRVRGGVLAEECAWPLRGFFRSRRREGVVVAAAASASASGGPSSTIAAGRRGGIAEGVGEVGVDVGAAGAAAAARPLALGVEVVMSGGAGEESLEEGQKPFVLTNGFDKCTERVE